jgi:hypothetical protein
VTFRFEYEVLRTIPELQFLFRLFLPSDGATKQHIVTEFREMLNSNPMSAGQVGAFELTLPEIALAPNRLMVYVWLGRAKSQFAYDVLDANVDLPPLHIVAAKEHGRLRGVAYVKHELRQIELPNSCSAGKQRNSALIDGENGSG